MTAAKLVKLLESLGLTDMAAHEKEPDLDACVELKDGSELQICSRLHFVHNIYEYDEEGNIVAATHKDIVGIEALCSYVKSRYL